MTFKRLIITVLAIVIVGYFNLKNYSNAQTASVIIQADIKISVCGDTVVEYPEDCEGNDLNGDTCVSLGYGIGTLSCDIACTFDTTLCPPPPAPPAPTESNNSSSDRDDDEDNSEDENQTVIPTTQSTTYLSARITHTPPNPPDNIPPILSKLLLFDADGNGTIESTEKGHTIGKWVAAWKNHINALTTRNPPNNLGEGLDTCDLNFDERCNIYDFSILLSYIGKSYEKQ